MPELRGDDELMDLADRALREEVGEALKRKFDDDMVAELSAAFGWTGGPGELLERVTNPYMDEAIDAVARNPAQSLSPEGCLVGAMRLALRHNIEPRNLAAGIDYVLNRAEELDLPHRLRFNSACAMAEDDMAAMLERLWDAPPHRVESAGDIPRLLAASAR